MKQQFLKTDQLISYFDKENLKGGIVANEKCIKRLKIKVKTKILANEYEKN